ncbi:hypothetical protein U1Q18_044685 [Sarracenia purpurea var. burkii]
MLGVCFCLASASAWCLLLFQGLLSSLAVESCSISGAWSAIWTAALKLLAVACRVLASWCCIAILGYCCSVWPFSYSFSFQCCLVMAIAVLCALLGRAVGFGSGCVCCFPLLLGRLVCCLLIYSTSHSHAHQGHA